MFNKKKVKTKFIIISGFAGSGKTTIGKELSRVLGYMYVDKDTLTTRYTDYILIEKGSNSGDRESDLYVNQIREIGYKTTFDLCMENLELGNDVILSIPFIQEIKDYQKFERLVDMKKIQNSDIDLKIVWIKHNIDLEHIRIEKRGEERDKYKLEHWEEYSKKNKDIKIDDKYNICELANDDLDDFNIKIEKILEWILN